jgi:nucleotide-binding universal stress UspA family protein
MSATFRTILVTTDLSELGNSAVPVALRLARAERARVALVHVLEDIVPNPLYAHYRPTDSPAERKKIEAEAREGLAALVPAGGDVGCELRVAHGDAATAICDAAQELGAELIVISSHGRTGMKRFLLGSVASRVVQHAPCSVLVLRPPE